MPKEILTPKTDAMECANGMVSADLARKFEQALRQISVYSECKCDTPAELNMIEIAREALK